MRDNSLLDLRVGKGGEQSFDQRLPVHLFVLAIELVLLERDQRLLVLDFQRGANSIELDTIALVCQRSIKSTDNLLGATLLLERLGDELADPC